MNLEILNKILLGKPLFRGKLRRETWGGIYLIRETLTMEVINETSFDILSMCNGENSTKEIIEKVQKEYDGNENQIYNEVLSYVIYVLLRGIISIKEIEVNEQLYDDLKPKLYMEKEIEETGPIHGLNYNVRKEEKPGFFKGKGVLGLEPNVLSAPINTLIEFTNNCNLKCVHCFADAEYCKKTENGNIEGELDTEQWKKVIDNLCDAGVFEILVSGGEALMRKDIFEIMEHITKRTGGFSLLSNMTLIDEKVALKLKEIGCYKVEGNLDGYNSETYDAFRGVKGSFDATVKGIKSCLKAGIPVRCNITATKKNIYDLKEVVKTAYEIGVRELVAIPLEPGGRARVQWSELEIPIEDSKKLMEFYADVKKWAYEQYGDEFLLVVPTSNFVRDEDQRIENIMDPNKLLPFCGAGKYHCSIDPYGNAILCPTAGSSIKITPGNCLEHNFKKIWLEGDVFKQIREYQLPCYDGCENMNCTGGCHVRSYQKNKTVVGHPGEDCRKYQMEKLGLNSVK